MPERLTDEAIAALTPGAARREVPDGGVLGLYLVVQPSGARAWAVRYRFHGRPRKLTIGPHPLLRPEAARELARAALRAVAEGRDPGAERAEARRAESDPSPSVAFAEVAAQFVETHAKSLRTWRETERLLLRGADLAPWRARDVRSIGRRDVLDALGAVQGRGSATQANRLFSTLRGFFAWCAERGVVAESPCAGLAPPAPETSRERVLSDAELVALWRAADEAGHPFGSAVQLLILTGRRRSEVLGAQWSEFDLDRDLWTVPDDRAAVGTRRGVPLSRPAVALIEGLPRIGRPARFVFTASGNAPFTGIAKALARLQRAAVRHMPQGERMPSWRLDDLRRTFAWGCARLGAAAAGSPTTRGRMRGGRQGSQDDDERALYAWAAHVVQLVAGKQSNVVTIGRRR